MVFALGPSLQSVLEYRNSTARRSIAQATRAEKSRLFGSIVGIPARGLAGFPESRGQTSQAKARRRVAHNGLGRGFLYVSSFVICKIVLLIMQQKCEGCQRTFALEELHSCVECLRPLCAKCNPQWVTHVAYEMKAGPHRESGVIMKFCRTRLIQTIDEGTDLGLLPELNAIVADYCLEECEVQQYEEPTEHESHDPSLRQTPCELCWTQICSRCWNRPRILIDAPLPDGPRPNCYDLFEQLLIFLHIDSQLLTTQAETRLRQRQEAEWLESRWAGYFDEKYGSSVKKRRTQ